MAKSTIGAPSQSQKNIVLKKKYDPGPASWLTFFIASLNGICQSNTNLQLASWPAVLNFEAWTVLLKDFEKSVQ